MCGRAAGTASPVSCSCCVCRERSSSPHTPSAPSASSSPSTRAVFTHSTAPLADRTCGREEEKQQTAWVTSRAAGVVRSGGHVRSPGMHPSLNTPRCSVNTRQYWRVHSRQYWRVQTGGWVGRGSL
eukprot:3120537-Rhodomonas_salina.1